ncbi:hypothetical protein K8P10_002693 [Leucobacter sp. Psy1]|nr:hypothetical protein K8P10_002693 [Leucobacter sp. Psy1]
MKARGDPAFDDGFTRECQESFTDTRSMRWHAAADARRKRWGALTAQDLDVHDLDSLKHGEMDGLTGRTA